MKFVASYSGGKDSILAIYRAIKAGHEPVALLTTCDEKNKHSWFHNVPYQILNEASNSIGIPLIILNTEGEKYAQDFENALESLKTKGVEQCVFGDIDIQEHFDWCNNRCLNVGIASYFPLWNENRKDLVYEFIDSGFEAIITVINTAKMDERYLGKILTTQLIDELEADGTDICGENGEYHTFVTGGHIFKENLNLKLGEIVRYGSYVRLPILY